MEELIKEYLEKRRKFFKEILLKYNIEGSEGIEDRTIKQEKNRIKYILKFGLDIGTIKKYIVKVELVKRMNEFYFKTKEELFRVEDFLK